MFLAADVDTEYEQAAFAKVMGGKAMTALLATLTLTPTLTPTLTLTLTLSRRRGCTCSSWA